MKFKFHIEGGDFSRAGRASGIVKGLLKQLEVPTSLINRVVVAMYEGEVNIAAHAWEGSITVDIFSEEIRILIKDTGPGIADIGLAMEEGFSTASQHVQEMGFGAGMGLPNMKRNSDIFHISSEGGQGTEVEITNRLVF